MDKEAARQINCGQELHVAGELAAAEECYRKALEIEPDHPIAKYNLGVVLEDTGREWDAILAYRDSIASYRYQPDARFNLARLLYREVVRQIYAHNGMKLKGMTTTIIRV